MNKKELLQIAIETAKSLKVEELYITADGQCFKIPDDAANHARTKEIPGYALKNEQLIKVIGQEETSTEEASAKKAEEKAAKSTAAKKTQGKAATEKASTEEAITEDTAAEETSTEEASAAEKTE